jgi:hypothetical protein
MATTATPADKEHPSSRQVPDNRRTLKSAAVQVPYRAEAMEDFLRGLGELSLDDLIAALRQSGFKRHPKFLEILERVLRRLEKFHIQGDIEVLQQSGVARELIAMATMGIDIAATCDALESRFGDKRERQREQSCLLSPVPFLRKLGNLWGEAAHALPAEMFPSPTVVANGLHFYADILKRRERIYRLAGTNSLVDVAKYAFAGVVRRATGTYHDREVSAVIGAALQDSDYHMETHRFWRKRTYNRLDQNLPAAALALQAANTILLEK